MVLTDEKASVARSVARISEPTAPVQPNTAAVVVMVEDFHPWALAVSNGTPNGKGSSETMIIRGEDFCGRGGCIIAYKFWKYSGLVEGILK